MDRTYTWNEAVTVIDARASRQAITEMENEHHITIFDRESARKTKFVDLQHLFSKNKMMILANFQKNQEHKKMS
jgi:hypothetical protein